MLRSVLIANRGEIARADRAHGAPARRRIDRGRLRRRPRTRRTPAPPTASVAIGGERAADSYLRIDAIVDAARSSRRRCGASGLRLPERERGLRRGGGRRRPGLDRPAAGGDAGDGRQVRSAPAHGRAPACRCCRATTATTRTRPAAARSGAHRLSAHGQGRGRRRRARHAPGARRRRARRGARVGRAPKRGGLRRRAPPARARARAAPRHVEIQVFADAHGRTHPPRRARLLGAAPAPEDHRGSALARGRRRRCAGAWATRRWRWRARVGYVGAGTVEFLLDATARSGSSR